MRPGDGEAELGASRRRRMAYEVAESFDDATDEEREAFAAYCAEHDVSRKRLKRSLFDSFLAAHRRQVAADARRERVRILLGRYGDLATEAGLAIRDDALVLTSMRRVQAPGLATELRAAPFRRFDALDVDPTRLDTPEAVTELFARLAVDLGGDAAAQLASAEESLQALGAFVTAAEHRRLLGEDWPARLELPQTIDAIDAANLAERRLAEAQTAVQRAKLRSVAARLAATGAAQLTGKTLQARYRDVVPFLSTTLVCDLQVDKALDRDALGRLADAPDESFKAVVDDILAAPRAALAERVAAQVAELAGRIKRLPHVDLLADTDIVRVVAPYYTGLDRALKQRRARHALVAVEERAREAKYRDDVEKLKEHEAEYADPARYYPIARALHRELVLFVGPTNSGKTWRALNELAQGESGAYLAPLRLLALEGQEELEKRGRLTSFLTGEERDLKEGAKFVSSTIEMLNLDTPVDTVVVDEVQLLADESRGWAWLAAVLGAPARRVVMTGSPDSVPLVRQLAEYLGEELTVHECHRFNELRVADRPIRLRDVTVGTAIVCFSRRDVLRLKQLIEENSPHRVAVVYGNLSPQVRREEARRFRSGEADILVATDAIAMGLNLPIKEVLFYATEKFDGEQVRELTAPEIRQIGGRAGRYGFAQFGVVNALNDHSLALIRGALAGKPRLLEPPYYVAPGPNHARIIGKVLGTESLERILTFFERAMEFSDDRFTRSNIDELSYLATFVDEALPTMPLGERLTIASAPVDMKSETVLGWFIERMLPAFRLDDPLDDLFQRALAFRHDTADNSEELRQAEDYLKTLTVYAWPAYRYPAVFTRLDDCEARRELVNAFIERSLRWDVSKRCAACGTKLAKDYPYRTCARCHARARGHHGPRHARHLGRRELRVR